MTITLFFPFRFFKSPSWSLTTWTWWVRPPGALQLRPTLLPELEPPLAAPPLEMLFPGDFLLRHRRQKWRRFQEAALPARPRAFWRRRTRRGWDWTRGAQSAWLGHRLSPAPAREKKLAGKKDNSLTVGSLEPQKIKWRPFLLHALLYNGSENAQFVPLNKSYVLLKTTKIEDITTTGRWDFPVSSDQTQTLILSQNEKRNWLWNVGCEVMCESIRKISPSSGTINLNRGDNKN